MMFISVAGAFLHIQITSKPCQAIAVHTAEEFGDERNLTTTQCFLIYRWCDALKITHTGEMIRVRF